MNQERVLKLVDALQELPDQRCEGILRTHEGTMCVEGMACEVYRRETGEGEWISNSRDTEFVLNHTAYGIMMPNEVADWYGFDGNPAADQEDMMEWNDRLHWSFPRMAERLKEALDNDESIGY